MKLKTMLLAALLCLSTANFGATQSLPSAKPEQVGLSSERLNRLTATLKADIDKGVIPGAVLLVARHGKVALFEAIGVRNPETKAPMTKDAIFRIYSMSKPITSPSPCRNTSRSWAASRLASRSRTPVASPRSSSCRPSAT
jgi:CubicO group peptidase (beta-lactamase class C family)